MTGPVPSVRVLPKIPGVWQGLRASQAPAVPTGLAALDAVLPGSGWPLGAVTELIPRAEGIGEISLLLDALRRVASPQRPIVFVRPPHVLYPPGLVNAGLPLSRLVWIGAPDDVDGRWAAEQALRSGAASAVVIWSETRAEVALRRLQLAAAETESLAFVYRPPAALRNSSPAAVRLALHADPGGLRIEVLKARGGRAGVSIPWATTASARAAA